MVDIGKINALPIVRLDKKGAYFDGGAMGDIFMEKELVPQDAKEGDTLDVFVYPDSSDNLIATTERTLAMAGEFALLDVVSVNKIGAFLDWGLPKDILVPFREQQNPMVEGRSYVAFVFVDHDTNRMIASTKLDEFLGIEPHSFKEADEVDLIIFKRTELGYKAIINNKQQGVLYKTEIFQQLAIGERTKGYIRKIREDGKIDLILHKPGYEKVDNVSKQVLDKLNEANGFIELNDKSTTQEIYRTFSISKKTFKKAVGALYKERLITIEEGGIRLVKK